MQLKRLYAFVCAGGEDLKTAEIQFDDHIRQIKYTGNRSVHWHEISDAAKRQKFLQENGADAGAEYFLLVPGGFDAHVHFNTPGFEQRDDIEHGSRAAAAGGVTRVADMPCTSIPPVTSLQNLETKLQALQNRSMVDYALWGGISGNDFNGSTPEKNIKELAAAGVIGFKAYLTSGMDSFRDLAMAQMEQAAAYVKSTGLPLAVHAEDKNLVTERQEHLQQIKNNSWQAYCFSRDEQVEALAVMKMIDISRRSGCRVHIVHISSQFGVELVKQARDEGLPVSAETCPHYLYFTNADFDNPEISNFLKTAPPVKSEYDRLALWTALRDGVLSFVTTDHAGCDPAKEKHSDNFWEVYGGIPGVEHRLPFMFSEGFLKGRLSLQRTIEVVSTNPAGFYRSGKTGFEFQTGDAADFALVDLWSPFTVRAKDMHSKGKYTPFEGIKLDARIQATYLRGEMIYERTEKFGTAAGVFRRAGGTL